MTELTRARIRKALEIYGELVGQAAAGTEPADPSAEFVCCYFLEHADEPAIAAMWDEFAETSAPAEK